MIDWAQFHKRLLDDEEMDQCVLYENFNYRMLLLYDKLLDEAIKQGELK